MTDLDQLSINTIRFLALDMVNAAQSGHPGTPMGAAPLAYTLWQRFLRHNPARPDWFNRDRFILSNGHASSLLFSLLHLTGYDLPLDELKRFRQLGSRTPGHPERLTTPGVEMTTGALGQGFASAVGLAIAETHLAAEFNMPDCPPIVDHFTYVLCSDGDLMEGLSAEAASLAGHLRLGKLIAIYDDNQVTIEGSTEMSFKEDVLARFAAYGWHTLRVEDGTDLEAISQAIRAAQAEKQRPTIILARTIIGHGNPRQGTGAAHFGALNAVEMESTRQALGWQWGDPFHIPPEVKAHMGQAVARGEIYSAEWELWFERYAELHPQQAAEFKRRLAGELPTGWDANLPVFAAKTPGEPTRMVNAPIVNALAAALPELIGGAADLAPNTNTLIQSSPNFSAATPQGRNIRFGVREHAMAAISNGIALHGGLRPYAAGFLIFSDYLRPALRFAALNHMPVIFVFTNDSIGVGEDGPTHQPIEQLATLRAMPGISVMRPCDANEVVEAWKLALENRTSPTCIIETRQQLPILDRSVYAPASEFKRGGYILSEAPGGKPAALIITSGSEVHPALDAQRSLAERGVNVRVVALPCWSLFQQQDQAYRDQVLPPSVKVRVAIEAGASLGWERWVGEHGKIIALDRFGVSGPFQVVFQTLGITTAAVETAILELLGKHNQ